MDACLRVLELIQVLTSCTHTSVIERRGKRQKKRVAAIAQLVRVREPSFYTTAPGVARGAEESVRLEATQVSTRKKRRSGTMDRACRSPAGTQFADSRVTSPLHSQSLHRHAYILVIYYFCRKYTVTRRYPRRVPFQDVTAELALSSAASLSCSSISLRETWSVMTS